MENKSQNSIENVNSSSPTTGAEDQNLNLKNDDIDLTEILKSILRRKRIVIGVASTVFVLVGLNTIYKRVYNPIYEGSFTLLIKDPIKTDAEINQGTSFQSAALGRSENKIDILIPFLRSPLVLDSLAKEIGTSSKSLISRINLRGIGEDRRNQGIINVTVKGPNRANNLKLLNSLEKLYLKVALDERQKKLSEGIRFLNKQAPFLVAKTNELQNKLADLRIKHNILDPTEEGIILKEALVEVDMKILELDQKNKRLKEIRSGIKNGTLSVNGFAERLSDNQEGLINDGLSVTGAEQTLLQEVISLNNKLSKAKTIYRPESLVIKGLESRLEVIQPLVKKNQMEVINLAIDSNRSRSKVLYEQKELINKTFLQQPLLIQRFDALTQELFLARENVASLNSTRENFKFELGQETIPWKILSPSQVDDIPISPKILNNLIQGLVAGIILGMVAALLRDRFDYVYFSPSEVTDELGVPLLSHIPYIELFEGVREEKKSIISLINKLGKDNDEKDNDEKDNDEKDNDEKDLKGKEKKEYQRFFYQESFRNLFTSLRYLNAEKKLKTIVLTSSIPAEGKSLMSILFAKTLSELGERVLLVDCDLRKPQLDGRLGMNNINGMSNILINPESKWEDAVQKVKGHKNWSVITAGRKAPDPTRLLSSIRMKSICDSIKKSDEYDFIILDSPPILGVSDASLISENTDGLILLATIGFVKRNLPKESINRLKSSKANVLGVITNSKREESFVTDIYEGGYGGYGAYGAYGAYGYVYRAYSRDTEGVRSRKVQDLNSNIFTEKLKSVPYLYEIILKAKNLFSRTIRWIDKK